MARKVIKAEGVEIHADKIRNKPLNMESGNHEGQNRKAEKNVTIEVTVPSSNEGSSDTHPPKGKIYKTDKADINAKRIFGPWPSKKFGKSQKKLRAEQDVSVGFSDSGSKNRRNGRSHRCLRLRTILHRAASSMQSSRFQGRIPHPVRIITICPPLTSGTSVCRTESPSEPLFCGRESAMRHAMETLDGKLTMRSARLTVLELAPLKRLGASPLSLLLLCTLRRRLPPHGQCSQNRGVPPSSGDIP